MTHSVFGYPLKLTEAWEDGSVYTFFLKTDGAKAGGAGGAPVLLGTPGGAQFRPNLVIVREAQGERDLERFAEEQRQNIQTRLPSARLVKEGKGKIAGMDAREREYQITIERGLPTLLQWHALLVRDGYCYHFCGTSTRERFEKDKKEFRALADSWK